MLFEIIGNQRGPFVWGGRAAERVGGRDEHKDAAILHAFELPSQQLRLWACVPGVRNDLRRRLVIAREGVVIESDARGNDHAVVRQFWTTLEPDGSCDRINRCHGVMNDVDAVSLRERLVAMRKRLERA